MNYHRTLIPIHNFLLYNCLYILFILMKNSPHSCRLFGLYGRIQCVFSLQYNFHIYRWKFYPHHYLISNIFTHHVILTLRRKGPYTPEWYKFNHKISTRDTWFLISIKFKSRVNEFFFSKQINFISQS